MSRTLSEFLLASKEQVDRQLAGFAADQAMASPCFAEALAAITRASQYALTNSGKRIRPVMVYAAARAAGREGTGTDLDHIACAVEIVHSYSLVHDDLPAMDDDDLRRGKPSLHVAYDEATAILVGDGLQSRAFELLAEAPGLSAEQRIAMVRVMAKAVGSAGMVGGQYIDIQATDTALSLEQLQTMHSLKTGALIRASLAVGGIAAEASQEQLSALDEYGRHIGLAFQVIDDILDVESDTETLGKTQGKDAEANKPTYVKLLGLDGAKTEAQRLLQAALEALNSFGASADHLRDLARYIVERDH
jgi:geranylgeranyl pyrophosphate synthase